MWVIAGELRFIYFLCDGEVKPCCVVLSVASSSMSAVFLAGHRYRGCANISVLACYSVRGSIRRIRPMCWRRRLAQYSVRVVVVCGFHTAQHRRVIFVLFLRCTHRSAALQWFCLRQPNIPYSCLVSFWEHCVLVGCVVVLSLWLGFPFCFSRGLICDLPIFSKSLFW